MKIKSFRLTDEVERVPLASGETPPSSVTCGDTFPQGEGLGDLWCAEGFPFEGKLAREVRSTSETDEVERGILSFPVSLTPHPPQAVPQDAVRSVPP